MEIDSAPGQGSRFKLIVPLSAGIIKVDRPASEKQQRISVGISSQLELKPAGAEKRIRIMLVDDHLVMRQGIAGLLRGEPGFEVAGEASDGESAVKPAREIWPDVILMDIGMPGMDGIQATRIIHQEFPEIHIIGFFMFQEPEQEASIRAAGAVGYLTKSGPAGNLINAIRTSIRSSQKAFSAKTTS